MPDFTTIVDVPIHDFSQYWFFGSIEFGDHWSRHGSDQYLFLCSMYDNHVHALKSTDGGLTWVDVGNVSTQLISGDAGPHYTIGIDGDTAYLFWMRTHNVTIGLNVSWAVDGISIRKFDMTSDSWGPEVQYSPAQFPISSGYSSAPVNTLNPQYFMRFIVRASGDYVMLFSSARAVYSGGTYSSPRLSYIPFNGTSFGTAQELPGQIDASKLYMGVGGVHDGTLTHFLGQSNQTIGLGESLLHWTLSSSGTMVGPQIVTSNLYGDHQTGQISDPWITGTKIICAAYTADSGGSSGTQSIRAYYASLSDTSTWTNVVITNDQDGLPSSPGLGNVWRCVVIGSETAATICYADYGSDFIFWTRTTTFPTPNLLICAWTRHSLDVSIWGSVYYSKSTDDGVTWSAPAVMFPDLSSHSGEMVHPSHGMQALQLEIASRAASSDPMTISCGSPPSGKVGTAYSHTFPATGGNPPYTFSITTGALPPGLSLGSTGSISGTPTTAGTYSFQVSVTDSGGGTGHVDCSISIGIGIDCNTPPGGKLGDTYSHSLTISGAPASSAVTVTGGALPPGLTIDDTGHISGTPTLGGSYTYTATVTPPARSVRSGSVIDLPDQSLGWDFKQCPNAPIPGAMGGHEYGGNQYLFLFQGGESPAGDFDLHALKSTDLGATWIDINSIFIPNNAGSGHGLPTYTTCMDGTTVYVMGVDLVGAGETTAQPNTGPILLYKYNLLTDGFETGGTPSGAPTVSKGWAGTTYPPRSGVGLHLLRRGAGDMLLLYTGVETIGANTYARIYVTTFNGISFGAGVVLPGQAGTADAFIERCAGFDASHNLHVILSKWTDYRFLYHIAMDSAGSFGTFQTIESNAWFYNDTSNLLDFSAPTDTIAFLAVRNRSSSGDNGDLAIYSAPGGSLTPTWTFHNLPSTANAVQDPYLAPDWIAGLGYLDGTLYAFWTQTGVAPSWSISAKQGQIHSSAANATDLTTWTAETTVIGPFDGGGLHWGAMQVGVWAGPAIGLGVIGNFEGYDDALGGSILESSYLLVYPPAGGGGGPSVTCGSPPDGEVGVAYSHSFPATGGTAPYVFTITTGTLPPGLALTSGSGNVSGIPTLAGDFPITVTVTDAADATGTVDCSLHINTSGTIEPVSVTCTTTVGYGDLSTSCGAPPVMTVGQGALYRPPVVMGSIGLGPIYDMNHTLVWEFPVTPPPGFHWETDVTSPNYGYLVGTPTTAGTFGFSYTVSAPDGQSVSNVCPLNVEPADGGGGGGGGGSIEIVCGNPPGGKVGVFYSHTFPVTGATGPTTYSVVVGALPPGITLDPVTGDLIGTPTAPGLYSFSVKVQQ